MSPADGEDPDEEDTSEEVAGMYEERVTPDDTPAPDPDSGGESTGEVGSDDSEEISIEPGGGEPETVTGTFYVKYAQGDSVTLHDVETTQICTLVENPGFERHEIVEATLVAQPPMGVSYLVEELDARYSIPAETSPESPTKQVRDIADEELDVGEAVAIEREGKGEIHILRVDPDRTDETVEELLDDEMTFKNAARYDPVERVEVRTDTDAGVVSIRYLP